MRTHNRLGLRALSFAALSLAAGAGCKRLGRSQAEQPPCVASFTDQRDPQGPGRLVTGTVTTRPGTTVFLNDERLDNARAVA